MAVVTDYLAPQPHGLPVVAGQPFHPMAFPSLQLQCLYSLVGRLEEYSSQTLSLLPASLRRQLLLLLPVADICRLEQDPVFMSGFDPDTIWQGLLLKRFEYTPKFLSSSLEYYGSAKDSFFSEVALRLLCCEKYSVCYRVPDVSKGGSKSDMVAYLLFGTRLECEDIVKFSYLLKRKSLGLSWLAPFRYSGELSLTDPEKVIQMFLDKFSLYPKRLYWTERDELDLVFRKSQIIHDFLSHIEAFNVWSDDYEDLSLAEKLTPLWLAITSSKPASLNSVTLSVCVSNLGKVITVMLEALFYTSVKHYSMPEGRAQYSQLRRLEIAGTESSRAEEHLCTGNLSYPMRCLIPFIDFQTSLESLIIEGLEDIIMRNDDECTSSYKHFGLFYNYLPYFIKKPSFKLLRLTNCKIPLNSIKSIITTFLSSPTDHDQSLEFIDCEVTKNSLGTYSSSFPLINNTTTPCICGEHKSLIFFMNWPLFTPQWLFEYPKLKLKQLKIYFSKFGSSYLPSLYAVSSLVESISCRIYDLGYGDCQQTCDDQQRQAFSKFLELSKLSELELFELYADDDSLLSVLTNALMQPLQLTCLRRLHFEDFYSTRINFRSFFDTLFSMPKERLINITLEIVGVRNFDQEDIVESWRTNSKGNKLKKFLFRISPGYTPAKGGGEMLTPVLIEPLRDIAFDIDVKYLIW